MTYKKLIFRLSFGQEALSFVCAACCFAVITAAQASGKGDKNLVEFMATWQWVANLEWPVFFILWFGCRYFVRASIHLRNAHSHHQCQGHDQSTT